MELGENKQEAKPIPVKKACNKFDKVVQTLANFEAGMNFQEFEKKKPKSFIEQMKENIEKTKQSIMKNI